MRLIRGEGVVIRKKGTFVPSYFRRLHPSGRHAIVEVSGKEERVSIDDLFAYRNGYAKRVRHHPSPPPPSGTPKVPTSAPKYLQRKRRENGLLIADALTLGISLSQTRVLALDDFVSPTRRVPNTLTTWVKAGGQASLVYVPNPDEAVTDAVRKVGGNGYTMKMDDFILIQKHEPLNFGVVYADFCGFWSTCAASLDLLMKNHRNMLGDEVVLHITTCRREGDVMDRVFEDLRQFSESAGYGHVFLVRKWYTERMNKGAFFLRRIKRIR